MTNLDAQIAKDLTASFFRVDNGFATNGSLGTTTARAIPVVGGTAVRGIFDTATLEGDRAGPRWWAQSVDGYEIGQYLTVTGQGTYMLAGLRPEGDGQLLEIYLEPVS